MHDPIPLIILTGFLGSGKTTLLRRYLERSDRGRVGVVVNEYGEIGLDQDLLVHAADQVEVLKSGCMCCARRADIAKSLHTLIQRARETGSSWIDQAVIETSGMADPAPIISTIVQDPWLRNNVSLRGVVCVLDAVAGPGNLELQREAIRQIAIADVVVLTKGDMRDAVDQTVLEKLVSDHVPDAVILDSQDENFDIGAVFDGSLIRQRDEESFRTGGDGSPLVEAPLEAPVDARAQGNHDTRSFILDLDRTIDWPVFTVWLSALLHRHGDRILRVKGTVFVASTGKPLVIHGVQHVMHPPTHLREGDGDGDGGPERSRLVFITAGLDKTAIETSLHRFLDAAASRQKATQNRSTEGSDAALMPAF